MLNIVSNVPIKLMITLMRIIALKNPNCLGYFFSFPPINDTKIDY